MQKSLCLSVKNAEEDIQKDQRVQNDMIKIRHKPGIAFRKDPQSSFEAFVVSPELGFACAEERIAPVAEKLDGEPERENAQKHPFAEREKPKERDAGGIEAKHDELRAF